MKADVMEVVVRLLAPDSRPVADLIGKVGLTAVACAPPHRPILRRDPVADAPA